MRIRFLCALALAGFAAAVFARSDMAASSVTPSVTIRSSNYGRILFDGSNPARSSRSRATLVEGRPATARVPEPGRRTSSRTLRTPERGRSARSSARLDGRMERGN
jgi:hypothetical protein